MTLSIKPIFVSNAMLTKEQLEAKERWKRMAGRPVDNCKCPLCAAMREDEKEPG